MSALDYDGMVFAGGGCRCFWQAGFFAEASLRMPLSPRAVAAASAGAALACVSLTGLGERAVRNFKQRAASNPRNLYPRRLLSSEPVFPHAGLFRDAIHETIDDDAFAALRSGPSFRVALTRAPRSAFGVGPSVFAGLFAYQLERWATGRVHGRWPRRLGLRVDWARADECESVEELADLLLHTSCTPPFTPAFSRDGHPVLDGGLTDNVPVAALDDCERVLVLLSRQFRRVPRSERLTYVQPSEPLAIGGWDYTDPAAIQRTFDLGRRDGEAFAKTTGPAGSPMATRR